MLIRKILFFIWPKTFGLWSLIRKQKKPADTSNRINHLILYWFVLVSYEKVVALPNFKGLTYWQLLKKATFHENEFVEDMPWLKLDLWVMLMKPGRFKDVK